MARVNIIRNAEFQRGQDAPTGWDYRTRGSGFHCRRVKGARPGLGVESSTGAGRADISQNCRCKAGEFYRIEIDVTCDLTTSQPDGGLLLSAQPLHDDKTLGPGRHTPPITRANHPVTIRTYWQAPPNANAVRVSITLDRVKGQATLLRARLIRILEPEEKSHILAVPPPRHSITAPICAQRVCLCGLNAPRRPLTAILSAYFGSKKVCTVDSADFSPTQIQQQSLILLDPKPPSAIGSRKALENLARDKVVVISLSAFAKLSQAALTVKRIEQIDDPIHAKVVFGDFATQGFALHDLFPYAWPGSKPGSYVQCHFRKTAKLKAFCEKTHYQTLLESVCDQDATTDRPICLFKRTEHGAVFVLDIDPVEAPPSTFGEPTLALHLLLSILGVPIVGLGQFTVPALEEADIRCDLREMANRLNGFVVHDEDVPANEVRHQLVTIGREGDALGLPLKPKPVILVRTGLASGDMESLYGAWLWFKQFVAPRPHQCPYAEELATQFRLAWVPLSSVWQTRQGWQRFMQAPPYVTDLELEGAKVAAVIDVASLPCNRSRVFVGGSTNELKYYSHWLSRLLERFEPGNYAAYSVNDGAEFRDRDAFAWRRIRSSISVDRLAPTQVDDTQRMVLQTGGTAIRLEIPSCDADFVANSIVRTDYTATLLELVIGLQYGIIAVNRGRGAVRLDHFAPVQPGQALTVKRSDAMLAAKVSRAG